MKSIKEEYQEYTSDYLLELRARGEHLSEERQQVIEEIFAERKEKLPEMPSEPVFSTKKKAVKQAMKPSFKYTLIMFLAISVIMIISKALTFIPGQKLIAIILIVFVVIYILTSNKSIKSI